MIIRKLISKLRISRLRWYDLKDVKPVSRVFGFDRGTPIDRFYMDHFLRTNRSFITGTVLEVADSHYSKKYAGEGATFEVLHVEASKHATIVGDLTDTDTLPANGIDCFICTQVYNFIFDFQKAIEGTHHLLKPGGVVLATVSGISQISRYDADRWGHFWSFYPQGIERAFKQVFGDSNVTLQVFGNSLAAMSFIKGIAAQELSEKELLYNDPDYPVTIGVIARKN